MRFGLGRIVYWIWVAWCLWDGWGSLSAGTTMLLVYLLAFAEVVAWSHDRERAAWRDVQGRLALLKAQLDDALREHKRRSAESRPVVMYQGHDTLN